MKKPESKTKTNLKRAAKIIAVAAVLSGLAHAERIRVAKKVDEARLDGCQAIASNTLNPMLQPTCVMDKNKLILRLTPPLSIDGICFDAHTRDPAECPSDRL